MEHYKLFHSVYWTFFIDHLFHFEQKIVVSYHLIIFSKYSQWFFIVIQNLSQS